MRAFGLDGWLVGCGCVTVYFCGWFVTAVTTCRFPRSSSCYSTTTTTTLSTDDSSAYTFYVWFVVLAFGLVPAVLPAISVVTISYSICGSQVVQRGSFMTWFVGIH